MAFKQKHQHYSGGYRGGEPRRFNPMLDTKPTEANSHMYVNGKGWYAYNFAINRWELLG